MKFLFLVLVLIFSSSVLAREKKIIYKYKKYEKFDFDVMGISGDTSNPGDLSISPRFRKDFSNTLPERRDFTREIRRSIQRIR